MSEKSTDTWKIVVGVLTGVGIVGGGAALMNANSKAAKATAAAEQAKRDADTAARDAAAKVEAAAREAALQTALAQATAQNQASKPGSQYAPGPQYTPPSYTTQTPSNQGGGGLADDINGWLDVANSAAGLWNNLSGFF
ncbi:MULTISPECIES: hypothetical protein [unclassified Corallococcus]|uniref:hypothetical protein n=1 Tax=unclassified Corallococcus TaxID=2685029 RepID=UPI001A8E28B2|nr:MULTISPECIES: hypothetical protein [unclassified Corallococcus]MBN9685393.1 hypothetical protein [Corallococcus sp. NCSPR001]WAS83156.1 hypothetical protein O0N60_28025 [Corallococcus sp. NCRR]